MLRQIIQFHYPENLIKKFCYLHLARNLLKSDEVNFLLLAWNQFVWVVEIDLFNNKFKNSSSWLTGKGSDDPNWSGVDVFPRVELDPTWNVGDFSRVFEELFSHNFQVILLDFVFIVLMLAFMICHFLKIILIKMLIVLRTNDQRRSLTEYYQMFCLDSV